MKNTEGILKKVERIVKVLNMLNSGTIHLAVVAKELEVTIRTVQRDMKVIENSGFPIYSGAKGAYSFVEGYSLEKMNLNPEEMILISLISDIAGSLGGNFNNVFSNFKKHFFDKENNPFFFKMNKPLNVANKEVVEIIKKAIVSRQKLKIVYFRNGQTYEYEVCPLKIAAYDGFWYLITMGRNDTVLKYRIDKISSAVLSDNCFETRIDIEKILGESNSIYADSSHKIEAVLKVTNRAVEYFKLKKYFPKQEIVKYEKNGDLIIKCTVSNLDEIIFEILNWIPYIFVVEPPELRETIKNKIIEYQKNI